MDKGEKQGRHGMDRVLLKYWAWRQELGAQSTKYYSEYMHKSLKAESCRRGREGTTGLAIWLSVQWEVPTDGTGGYFPNRCYY